MLNTKTLVIMKGLDTTLFIENCLKFQMKYLKNSAAFCFSDKIPTKKMKKEIGGLMALSLVLQHHLLLFFRYFSIFPNEFKSHLECFTILSMSTTTKNF